eukprot:507634_1
MSSTVTSNHIHIITLLLLLSIDNFTCNMCIVKPDIIGNNEEYYIGTVSDPLSYQNVKCNPSRDCYIQCTDTSACVETYVECASPNCIIQCSGSLSCEKMEIKTINSPVITLSCSENFACLNTTLSVIADNSVTNQATISCTKTDSCHETIIYSNTNTRFECGTGQFSCRYTKVYVNSGTANNILTDYECKRGHNTCSNTELHVTGNGTGNAVQVYCASSSGSSGDNCQYVNVYCNINGYNCKVTGGNPYYSSLGSKIFCRGGQGTTCTHWDGDNRWFQYATWTPYPTPVGTPFPTIATLPPTYCPTTSPTIDPTNDPTTTSKATTTTEACPMERLGDECTHNGECPFCMKCCSYRNVCEMWDAT